MITLNLSRKDVESKLDSFIDVSKLDEWVFICINCPGEPKTILPNGVKNRLDLFFWDVIEKTEVYDRIPEPTDAGKIIDFLSKNQDKNVCVHCTAGKSRSGAITTFLVGNFNYTCPTLHRAKPNVLLLNLLHNSFHKQKDKFK